MFDNKYLLIVLGVISVISLSAAGYMGIQLSRLSQKSANATAYPTPTSFFEMPTATPALSPTAGIAITPAQSQQWSRGSFGDLFYEYPRDWNVAYLWDTNLSDGGITMAIDPLPINTSPRDGPLSTFSLYFINGKQNPDEIYEKEKGKFTDADYSDIKTETLQNGLGEVLYYKGKFKGEMYLGETSEKYLFIYGDKKDPLNRTVVIANMVFNKNEKYSEMFRHLILSFKKTTQ